MVKLGRLLAKLGSFDEDDDDDDHDQDCDEGDYDDEDGDDDNDCSDNEYVSDDSHNRHFNWCACFVECVLRCAARLDTLANQDPAPGKMPRPLETYFSPGLPPNLILLAILKYN